MKEGLEFFPLEVYMDKRFELIEAEFGLAGFAIIVKLFQRIFAQFGYYGEFTRGVVLLFSKSIGMGGNTVSEIVEASVKQGVFDKTLFDKYQILTSVEIQKKYFKAVSRRKSVKVKSEYLLVDCAQFNNIEYISGENVDILKENAYISEQSKVKYSKVKKEKSIEKKRAGNPLKHTHTINFKKPDYSEIISYCKNQNLRIDVNRFYDYYESNGWMIGKNRMRDWRAAVRNWSRLDFNKNKCSIKSYDMDEIEAAVLRKMEKEA